ncbi:MAG TPA: SpoIIE family protein phosphatase [Anaerolineae bacterium]
MSPHLPSSGSWEIVPYEGKTAFKRVRVRDDARIRDVLRHLQSHDCVALIGPPFSEKTALLRDVAAVLPRGGRYRPLYLDLWQTNSEDESGFFTSLAALIERALAAVPAGVAVAVRDGAPASPDGDPWPAQALYLPRPGATVPTAHAFQTYLGACADAQPSHLVLLIDHLQALPHDLVHSLLLALRAAYMERPVDASRQLMAVVAGSMNLVGLSAGPTSPFNVARPVLAGPLTAEQTEALAQATLTAHGFAASAGALARIVEWAAGDHYLVPQLCGWAAETIRGYRRSLIDRRVVDRAAQHLLADEQGLAPVHEAIRLIEEDPDTILDVLHLLQQGTLPRSRAHQLPTRTGADRLQLSGAVVLDGSSYVLKNAVYREGLARHFTTERVGHILRIAGRWQEAIAYLAPQVDVETAPPPAAAGPATGNAAQAQLLEATVQSIYACDSLARACELLARGLQQGFGLADLAIYQAIPAQARLVRVYPRRDVQAGKAEGISLLDPESVEARAFAYGHYALRGLGDEARLVVALTAGSRRLGVVTIERYGRGRGPRELPGQLPDLLHFLGHAGLAIAEVSVRAAHREIGQAVLEAGTVQPTLHRVLETISEGLGCEATNLYLLGPGGEGQGEVLAMAAGIGQLWSPEWQAQARFPLADEHPAAVCLRSGRMVVTAGSDERLNRGLIARFGLDRYSWVYLPLTAAGRPLGTLELGYSEALHFVPGAEGQADLAAFANQVAIAVHNMQLLRRTDEALARRVAELEKLRSSSLALSATLDVATILDRIIRDVRALFPGSETTVWEYDEAAGALRVLRSSLADPAYLAQRPAAGSITYKAAVTRQLQTVADLAGRPAAADDPAVRLGLRGLMAAPLISRDRVLGAINLYAYGPEPAGGGQRSPAADAAAPPAGAAPWPGPGTVEAAGAAELLEAFAAHAAVAIENARLHEEELQRQRLAQELAVAQSIQRSMLPTANPDLPGWQFAAAYRSARVVGGDFYDFCELPGDPGRLGILIADVTDKGIPAALFMALSRTVIRAMALNGLSPAAALINANDLIRNDSRSDLALTAIYAVLDPVAGVLRYANGGHNRPLWLQAATGAVDELAAAGIILGAFEDIRLEERQIEVSPGDVLVFYTDGITDAVNPEVEMFGEERLTVVLAAHAGEPAQAVLDAIMAEVALFAGDAEQADDITCVVVKRTNGSN